MATQILDAADEHFNWVVAGFPGPVNQSSGEIGQLNKLESLNYSYNNIASLPNELENLKNTLKEFNLTGNPLSPETLSKLKTMLPNTRIIF